MTSFHWKGGMFVSPPNKAIREFIASPKYSINPFTIGDLIISGPLLVCRCSAPMCHKTGYRNYYYCRHHLSTVLGLELKHCKHGMGLFATRDFRPQSRICKFGGQIVTLENLKQFYKDMLCPYAIELRHSATDELFARSPVAYCNDPVNVERLLGLGLTKKQFYHAYRVAANKKRSSNSYCYDQRGKAVLIAKRRIRKGEEIKWPYGPSYWWV
jgi:hypothetical protein